jgi:hypothetical protein
VRTCQIDLVGVSADVIGVARVVEKASGLVSAGDLEDAETETKRVKRENSQQEEADLRIQNREAVVVVDSEVAAVEEMAVVVRETIVTGADLRLSG